MSTLTSEEWKHHLERHGLSLPTDWRPWRRDPLPLPDGTSLTWTPDDYGVMPVRTDPHRSVGVCLMLYNARVITWHPHTPMMLTGGWCYVGTDALALARALHAAWTMSPDHSAPPWHDKTAFAG